MIELQYNNRAMKLYFKGRLIINHRPEQPVLELGHGTPEFREKHANFTIRDDVFSRVCCPELNVIKAEPAEALLEGPEGTRIRFTEEEGLLVIRVYPGTSGEVSAGGREAAEVFTSPRPMVKRPRIRKNGRPSLKTANRLWLRLSAEPWEHVYGCGEQFSRTDLRGRKLPLWVEEQGIGRGRGFITPLANAHSSAGGHWYSTYFPQTSFVSSGGWYCAADASAYAEFDFSPRDSIVLHFWEFPEIRIGVEDDFLSAVAAHNRLQGLQPPLPEWVYDGMWLGVQGGSGEIERKLANAREAGMKVSALWAQDWEGKRITAFGKQLMWNWKHSRDEYPDLPGQIMRLKAEGVRFLGYINPFLAIEGDLYREAHEKGYLVKDPRGNDYMIEVTTFPAALIDLTNPRAFEWIKGIIKEHMIGIGLAGWMCDYGEYLPTDAVLHSGESAERYHNRYTVEWARANREAVEEAGALGDVVFFNRSGYNGVSKYALSYWGGDQLVDWSLGDGLATAITAGITIGFNGVGFFHSDLGGFTSVAWIRRTKELFLRWAEYAPFNQIMRSHESNRPDNCWQFNTDRETLQHLARMTRVYAALKPYHLHLAGIYQKTAIPPIRHPALGYPDDRNLYPMKYEYLYGPDLLVAPVFLKQKTKHRLYLPDDAWIHLWSGREMKPGYCTVEAPIGSPPVFYRRDSHFAGLFEKIRVEEGP